VTNYLQADVRVWDSPLRGKIRWNSSSGEVRTRIGGQFSSLLEIQERAKENKIFF